MVGKPSIERRDVLKVIGASVSSAGALALPVSSKPEGIEVDAQKFKEPYNSAEAARKAVDEYGSDLLKRLVNREVLEEPSIVPDESSQLLTQREQFAEKDGIYVSAIMLKGVPTGRIAVTKTTLTHTVKLFVHPHADRHYAIITSHDGQEQFVLDDDEVGTTDFCQRNNYCTGIMEDCFGVFVEYEYVICTDGRCYADSQSGCCGDSDNSPC